MEKTMELKKLNDTFYVDNPIVNQALDFDSTTGSWMRYDQNGVEKIRGHGVVQIQINNLIFAIPVRSNIKHNECLLLEVNRGQDRRVKGMGLDYSKALLIRDASHVSDEPFVLRSKAAGRKLVGKADHVAKQFNLYVNKYVKAVRDGDRNILNSDEYRYTTLINYHTEIGL
uniref:Uncharacterized protein n=1 Tax=Edwardsiella piscicida TaxID=1263550 RepID=A0A8F5V6T5_EDWPI|nr:hypothetical protein [Edwardsiella piscicida]QXO85637.1 hypothetical protein [Edwardsiella piscicida]